MAKKRPAASSEQENARLRRENAKLKKDNKALRGEDSKKKPPVGPKGYAYVTAVVGGKEYSVSYEMEDFEKNSADGLCCTVTETMRDGKDIELFLKGGKKVNLKKNFKQNGITPNSYVYGRYTGKTFWDADY